MPTIAMPSLPKSQLPLADNAGASIIPQRKSKCPKCGMRDWCPVIRTIQGPNIIIRERYCKACSFHFETEEERLNTCEKCGSDEGFFCVRAERVLNGIMRVIKCCACKKNINTKEKFPILNPRTSKDFSDWRR